jgi:aspartate-semialdehyde dehydrogenase
VSGAGKDAMDELFSQTKAVYTNDELVNNKFPKRIAFNVIPQIDVFMEDGFTKEEWKMMAETKKILDPKIKLTATCVRVPVFVGHSEAVNIEFENPISADEARNILRTAPGCLVIDKREPAVTSRLTDPLAKTPPTSAASARMRRWRTASFCGACLTICARALRSTQCRSRNALLTASCFSRSRRPPDTAGGS